MLLHVYLLLKGMQILNRRINHGVHLVGLRPDAAHWGRRGERSPGESRVHGLVLHVDYMLLELQNLALILLQLLLLQFTLIFRLFVLLLILFCSGIRHGNRLIGGSFLLTSPMSLWSSLLLFLLGPAAGLLTESLRLFLQRGLLRVGRQNIIFLSIAIFSFWICLTAYDEVLRIVVGGACHIGLILGRSVAFVLRILFVLGLSPFYRLPVTQKALFQMTVLNFVGPFWSCLEISLFWRARAKSIRGLMLLARL